MYRINELIQKLCPDGVEYKKLEEVFVLKNGYTPSKSNPDYWNDGTVPWFRMEDIRRNGRILNKAIQNVTEKAVKKLKFPSNSLIVATTATIGEHALIECDFLCNQQLTCITIKDKYKDKLSIKYCFYYFDIIDELCKKIANQSGGMPIVSLSKMRELSIPVPPLEVQREIVRVLDSFTLLTAELTAELTARKKQYEYYRDYLLNRNTNIKTVKLKDIATQMYRGNGIKREQVKENGIPCVRYGEIYTDYGIYFDKCKSYTDETLIKNKKYIEYGDILFAITGESVEDIGKSTAYVGQEKCLVGGDILVMKHNQNPKYLSYVLSTNNAKKQKSKGKIKSKVVHTNANSIGEIEIPLPSREVQDRLVDVLDNFETICNDLNIGLPAEIEARKKQYEFYRNALLTFTETGDIIAQTDRQTIIRLIQYVFGFVKVRLSDIGTIVRGSGLQKSDFTDTGIGCIHYGQIYTRYGTTATSTISHVSEELGTKLKKAQSGDIIFAVTSENLDDVCKCVAWLGKDDIAIGGHSAVLKHNQNSKYLAYYFQSSDFQRQKRKIAIGTKVIEVAPKKLENIEIILTSLDEQNRIAMILERFDNLCHSISSGLPAEIEARQKQYEYYRDKLLTFKEV